MARVPRSNKVFQEGAEHKRAFQRTGFKVYRTIEQARLKGKTLKTLALKMQITVPNTNAKDEFRPDPKIAPPPWPVVVLAHGGGWIRGSPKGSQRLAAALAIQGIVCVNVAFRLTPRLKGRVYRRRGTEPYRQILESHQFPAAVRDLKAAVRRARWKTEEGVLAVVGDPDNVGVCGTSSGASLLSTVAVTDGVANLEGLNEKGVMNTLQVTKGADCITKRRGWPDLCDLGDLHDYPSAPDFVALEGCPHPDLAKQFRLGKARGVPGSVSYTENGKRSSEVSPSTYLVQLAQAWNRRQIGLPEFLFFHAENDATSPFLGIDSDADVTLSFPEDVPPEVQKMLKDRKELAPGFQQLLKDARASSKLFPLGNVGHIGWHAPKTLNKIAFWIGVFARGGLKDVDAGPLVRPQRVRFGGRRR